MARFGSLLVIVVSLLPATHAKDEGGLRIKHLNKEETVPCQPEWYFFDGKCYKLGKNEAGLLKLNWDNAAAKCIEYGGHLATISTNALQRFVVLHFLMDAKRSIWIGLYKPKKKRFFEWHDGTSLIYTNWGLNEPSKSDFDKPEDCVEIMYNIENINGKWNNYDCNVKMPFVCQMEQDSKFNSPDPRYCPEELGGGWRFRDFCLNFVREEENWDDAEEHCVKHYNGHLATISDTAIKYYIDDLLERKYRRESYWIGIHFRNGTLQKWSSGEYVDLYIAQKFRDYQGSPRKYSLSDSCSYVSDEESWEKDNCLSPKNFICQFSISNKSSSLSLPKLPGYECPGNLNDWVDVGGEKCYYFGLDLSFSWHEANFKCMQKGGFLASIHSQEEADILAQFISFYDHGIHIGLLRNLNRREFIWADGSKVDFEAWDFGEPNSDSEKCVELKTASMKWNDIPCNAEKRYICSVKKITANENLVKAEERHNYPRANSEKYKEEYTSGVPALNILGIISTIALVVLIVGGAWCHFQPWGKRNNYVRST